MSSNLFSIHHHVLPCQHIREYPRATRHTQEQTLYMDVKQYQPLDNLAADDGSVTIIGAGGIGFPKVGEFILLIFVFLVERLRIRLLTGVSL